MSLLRYEKIRIRMRTIQVISQMVELTRAQFGGYQRFDQNERDEQGNSCQARGIETNSIIPPN